MFFFLNIARINNIELKSKKKLYAGEYFLNMTTKKKYLNYTNKIKMITKEKKKFLLLLLHPFFKQTTSSI